MDLIEAVLGESLVDLSARVAEWAESRKAAIRRVALALVGLDDASATERQMVEYSDEWELTEHDVQRLLERV